MLAKDIEMHSQPGDLESNELMGVRFEASQCIYLGINFLICRNRLWTHVYSSSP